MWWACLLPLEVANAYADVVGESVGAKWLALGRDLLHGPGTGPRIAAHLVCAIDVTIMTACSDSANVTAGWRTDLQYSRADS
jgi:hypothetical protein